MQQQMKTMQLARKNIENEATGYYSNEKINDALPSIIEEEPTS